MPFHSDINPQTMASGPAMWAAFIAVMLMAGRKIVSVIKH